MAFHQHYPHTSSHARQMLTAGMYLLRVFDDFRRLGIIDRTALACRIFGRQRVENSIKRIVDLIRSWGYSRYGAKDAQWAVCTLLLAAKSPRLEEVTPEVTEKGRTPKPYSKQASQYRGRVTRAGRPRHHCTPIIQANCQIAF